MMFKRTNYLHGAMMSVVIIFALLSLQCLFGCSAIADGMSFSQTRTWTAPADNIGCIQYEGKYAADSMDLLNNWDDTTLCFALLDMPAPSPPGTPEQYTCTLPNGVWAVVIRTYDFAGNYSVSNAAAVTIDGIPPDAIADLK